MFNETQSHAERGVLRAITGGAYKLFGPYGTIVSGTTFPTRGTIPMSSPKAGTIISQGTMVRGTSTTFKTDVQEEDYIHANNVVRKVRHVISDTLLELMEAFPADISTAHGLRICRPQVYKSIYAKNTHASTSSLVQEAPFAPADTYFQGGAPISFDATGGGQLDFTLSY
jgi:hypothetical protein